MKKLLTILGSLGMVATAGVAAATVVSCGTKDDAKTSTAEIASAKIGDDKKSIIVTLKDAVSPFATIKLTANGFKNTEAVAVTGSDNIAPVQADDASGAGATVALNTIEIKSAAIDTTGKIITLTTDDMSKLSDADKATVAKVSTYKVEVTPETAEAMNARVLKAATLASGTQTKELFGAKSVVLTASPAIKGATIDKADLTAKAADKDLTVSSIEVSNDGTTVTVKFADTNFPTEGTISITPKAGVFASDAAITVTLVNAN